MTLFVDTSVWSLALRRDQPSDAATVRALMRALETGERVMTTGLVLQELLQGFSGPKAQEQIVDRFAELALIVPDRDDHIAAAALRNQCRKKGVQVETIDALVAQLCIRHELVLLTTDEDFGHIARHSDLRLWEGTALNG
ncbi:MAG TPA: PIN domain-containing protein [Steroidobacteraceae bacterium]|nr:PIN domain-containing protein [Steroidobacteraceae bacterium]